MGHAEVGSFALQVLFTKCYRLYYIFKNMSKVIFEVYLECKISWMCEHKVKWFLSSKSGISVQIMLAITLVKMMRESYKMTNFVETGGFVYMRRVYRPKRKTYSIKPRKLQCSCSWIKIAIFSKFRSWMGLRSAYTGVITSIEINCKLLSYTGTSGECSRLFCVEIYDILQMKSSKWTKQLNATNS